jgi:serine/threonine protein kinase
MVDSAFPIPFPKPEIFEAFKFTLEAVNGNSYRCIRRNDQNDIAYIKVKIVPGMSTGKGDICYGFSCSANEQGNYQIYGNEVVIKTIHKNWLLENPDEDVMSEIFVAQTHGDGNHIFQLYTALHDDNSYYIIMPFRGTNLFETFCNFEFDHREFARRFIENLNFLRNSLGILHCDISAENIIVVPSSDENQFNFPLIDFAMARQCANDAHGNYLQVTREARRRGKTKYMSPEMWNGDDLYFGVDMWAFGCTLFFLWTEEYLYESQEDACWRFFALGIVDNPAPPRLMTMQNLWRDRLTEAQRDLLGTIFEIQPERRATPDDLMNHDYFRN